MLRIFKSLEREAGRRAGVGQRWGARALDIDLIDHAGRVNGWLAPTSGRCPGPVRQSLVMPHPQAHLRAFVLIPLLEVVPHWWHPALRQPGRQLLARLSEKDRASVLEHYPAPCDQLQTPTHAAPLY